MADGIDDLRQQLAAAQAEAERLRVARDELMGGYRNAMNALAVCVAERDDARADLARLAGAARRLIARMGHDSHTGCSVCTVDAATPGTSIDDDGFMCCDEHKHGGCEDKLYAPALRDIAAALPASPPAAEPATIEPVAPVASRAGLVAEAQARTLANHGETFRRLAESERQEPDAPPPCPRCVEHEAKAERLKRALAAVLPKVGHR